MQLCDICWTWQLRHQEEYKYYCRCNCWSLEVSGRSKFTKITGSPWILPNTKTCTHTSIGLDCSFCALQALLSYFKRCFPGQVNFFDKVYFLLTFNICNPPHPQNIVHTKAFPVSQALLFPSGPSHSCSHFLHIVPHSSRCTCKYFFTLQYPHIQNIMLVNLIFS